MWGDKENHLSNILTFPFTNNLDTYTLKVTSYTQKKEVERERPSSQMDGEYSWLVICSVIESEKETEGIRNTFAMEILTSRRSKSTEWRNIYFIYIFIHQMWHLQRGGNVKMKIVSEVKIFILIFLFSHLEWRNEFLTKVFEENGMNRTLVCRLIPISIPFVPLLLNSLIGVHGMDV